MAAVADGDMKIYNIETGSTFLRMNKGKNTSFFSNANKFVPDAGNMLLYFSLHCQT